MMFVPENNHQMLQHWPFLLPLEPSDRHEHPTCMSEAAVHLVFPFLTQNEVSPAGVAGTHKGVLSSSEQRLHPLSSVL